MGKLKMDKAEAAELIRVLWAKEGNVAADQEWLEKIEHLSRLCVDRLGKTHIAMLGTAILAKALHPEVDLFAFKPTQTDKSASSYSARTLCHGVLVPLAAELGFHLGATGREPLNNQPYFRMRSLDDGTPAHEESREAYEFTISLIRELQQINSPLALRSILLSFLIVRSKYQPRYATSDDSVSLSPIEFVEAVQTFISNNSERGARAQAVVAGLFDVFAGPANVVSGRIHDPSRDYPGDVCVIAAMPEEGQGQWAKAVEVRDKPVTEPEVYIFGKRCADSGGECPDRC